MPRYGFALSLAAATALGCINLSDNQSFLLVVAPVLDSVFVGDTLLPRDVYLQDVNGVHHDPGAVTWSISPTSVATIDAVGRIAGKSKGAAYVFASASGGLSASVVIVSRPLELTPLLDTIYLMPGDTITVPIAIAQKNPGAPTLQFDPSPMSSVYAIDANTGLVTAQAAGGPILYRAHLTDGVSTVSDSGAIVVMSLTDTTSGQGRFFMTTFGTAIRHQSGGALAVNYERLNGKLAFQLVDTATSDTLDERVLITLPDSVLGTGPPLEIDSISPDEVNVPLGSARDPRCTPPRPWALWASIPANPQRGAVVASAHGTPSDSLAGSLSITQYMPLQSGGAVIGGRYRFQARRFDLYSDPLGAQTIRGTFVAPLRERHTTCPG